jgi:hypothetical protein
MEPESRQEKHIAHRREINKRCYARHRARKTAQNVPVVAPGSSVLDWHSPQGIDKEERIGLAEDIQLCNDCGSGETVTTAVLDTAQLRHAL